MKLETERLLITDLTMDMARAVHENSLDDDNRRFVPDEVFETLEDAQETVEFLISQYGAFEGPLVHPVILKDGGANIGYVQLVPLADGEWEIGYHIAKKYTGHGYATEAVKAFLPVMAKAAGTAKVYGICLKDNAASIRVMNKCGFTPEFDGIGEYQGEMQPIYKAVWQAEEKPKDIEAIIDNMIRWAQSREGDRRYAGWCLSFIEDALEQSNDIEIFGGDSAKESSEMYADALRTGEPEKGAFVFYDCLCPSEDGDVNWGHCGICLGEGKVIHAWDVVRTDDYTDIEKLTALTGDHPRFIGWVPVSRVLAQPSDR